MAAQHNPTPWAFEKKSYGEFIVDSAGRTVAGMVSVTGSIGDEINKDNAASIVRAVNAHDDLIDALKLALEYWAHRQQRYKNRHPVWVQSARTALAKAEAL